MLVLTRKLDEAIRIGEDIKITVIRVKGNTVRLGIEAPRSVRVVRDELDKHTEASVEVSGGSCEVPVGILSAGLSQMQSADDGAVIATVVDSPQPSGTRLFMGKVTLARPAARLVEHEGGDQAAPLRAFLRGGRKLQAAS